MNSTDLKIRAKNPEYSWHANDNRYNEFKLVTVHTTDMLIKT